MRSIPALTILALLAGCSAPLEPTVQEPASNPSLTAKPLGHRGNPFSYPLDLGNRWQYHRVFTVSAGPEATPFPPIVTRTRIESFMSCVEAGAIDYVVEHRVQTDTTVFGPRIAHQWIRYRQDMRGLYEKDVSIAEPASCEQSAIEELPPLLRNSAEEWLVAELTRALGAARTTRAVDPARVAQAAAAISARLALVRAALGPSTGAPGGALPDELTRLRYPLVVGSAWNVRETPFVVSSTVAGRDHVTLSDGKVPAYRVDTHIPSAFGPADRIHNWYGRAGWLGLELHFEVGTGLGQVMIDETIVLEEVDLLRGRF